MLHLINVSLDALSDLRELFSHLVLNYSTLTACQAELERVCSMLVRLAHTLVGHAFDLGSPREVADVS